MPAPTAHPACRAGRRVPGIVRHLVLAAGALAFLFPFYYMLVGSLQPRSDPSLSGAVPHTGLTLDNYRDINDSIGVFSSLLNSGIFTGGVIVCTIVFGVLTGYALARLHFRGRGMIFGLVLLLQMVPFQLMLIPLYVLIVRDYGLADSHAGMILPFAINATAVFVFRQFFLQLPEELFAAARVDGAGELRVLWSVALPLIRPVLLAVVVLSFIGPWNEFLWPFLVTKDPDMQPMAVSLANYLSNTAYQAVDNPLGAVLAGACLLAAPAVALLIIFQRHFTSTDIGSGIKG